MHTAEGTQWKGHTAEQRAQVSPWAAEEVLKVQSKRRAGRSARAVGGRRGV